MRIITKTQRTPEWYAARLGCITGSRASDAVSKPRAKKDEWSKAQLSYLAELVAEVLTGECKSIDTAATRWGIDHEDDALAAYSEKSGHEVMRTGFIKHDDFANVGVSLDASHNDFKTNVEVKCPYNSANHVQHMLGDIDIKYLLQMRFGMWVTGASACDFVSYDPRMPEKFKTYVKRIELSPVEMDMFDAIIPKLSMKLDDMLFRILGDETIDS